MKEIPSLYFRALKILLQTDEDKLTVVLNNGLISLADVSLSCLFSAIFYSLHLNSTTLLPLLSILLYICHTGGSLYHE